MQRCYGKAGTPYVLDSKLGEGGEGAAYTVKGHPGLVAKLYRPDKLAAKPNHRATLRDKIATMLEQPVAPYIGNTLTVAWPQDLLLDGSGAFVGYVMPRVHTSHHIFEVESPLLRGRVFPKYEYRFSVVVAYNLALAIIWGKDLAEVSANGLAFLDTLRLEGHDGKGEALKSNVEFLKNKTERMLRF